MSKRGKQQGRRKCVRTEVGNLPAGPLSKREQRKVGNAFKAYVEGLVREEKDRAKP